MCTDAVGWAPGRPVVGAAGVAAVLPHVGWLAVVAFLVLFAIAAGVLAARVAGGSVSRFLVATWLLGTTGVVVVAILLSPFALLTRPALVASASVVALCAVASAVRWRIRPPSLAGARSVIATVVRDPALAVLAAGNVVALSYSTALALFTPPSEDDAITYHLLRSAFWKQDAAIGWIRDVVDLRANVSPPVSEILVAVFMTLGGHERFAAIPQLVALPILGVAAYCIGRRVGLDIRASALGGLAVPLLPGAVIQSGTAMNDVLCAAFLGAAAVFVLGERKRDTAVAATALALALGTKTAALFVVPSLALLVIVGQPWRRWLPRIGVGALALVVGSAWYLVNRRETGKLSGGLTEQQGTQDFGDLAAHLARFTRYAQSAIELPGGIGRDRLLYVLVGLLLVGVGLARRRPSTWVAGLLVAAVPLVLPLRDLADRVYVHGWFKLGREDLAAYDPGDFSGSIAATGYTWYGPVGLALVVVSIVVVVLRRRTLPVSALVLATAPLLALASMAVLLEWGGAYGRLIMGAVVISGGTWGVVARWRAATIAVAATSVLVAVTSLVWWNKKPLGVRLLEPARSPSVWSTPRWKVQEVLEGSAPFLELVDRTVPRNASIGVLAPLPPYSLFGPELTRHVEVREDTGDVGWLVVPDGAKPACPGDWEPVSGSTGTFELLRRTRSGCAPR